MQYTTMQTHTQAVLAVFDKNAQLYQDKFMNVDLYGETFDAFCRRLPAPGASLLDLACGPGNITRHLLQQRPDFRVLGIDIAPNMIALARQNNPEAEFLEMDCRDIAQLGRRFDGILCGFLLPYLSREEAVALIKQAASMLNPGGVLYLSTMEDDYEQSGIRYSSNGEPLYQYFHEAGYLTEAMTANGLHDLETFRKRYPGKDGEVVDLVLVGSREG